MKKIIICIISAVMFVSNVYAKEVWYIMAPCIDSQGEIVNDEYDNAENVEFDFKILEIVDKLVRQY